VKLVLKLYTRNLVKHDGVAFRNDEQINIYKENPVYQVRPFRLLPKVQPLDPSQLIDQVMRPLIFPP